MDRALNDLRGGLKSGIRDQAALEHMRVEYGLIMGKLFAALDEEGDRVGLIRRAALLDAADFDWKDKAQHYLVAARAALTDADDRAAWLYQRASGIVAERTGLRYSEMLETIAERVAARDLALVNPRVILAVEPRKARARIWSVERFGVSYPNDEAGCKILEESVTALEQLGRKMIARSLKGRVQAVLCAAPANEEARR